MNLKTFLSVDLNSLQIANHDTDDIVRGKLAGGKPIQVFIERNLRRSYEDLFLRPYFSERAKLRRSIYGFCTRMNF